MSQFSLDICHLSQQLQSNKISLEELLDIIYERIDNYKNNPVFIHLIPKEVNKQVAKNLEQRRANKEVMPLYGIPIAVKDNIDVKGVPTTAACKQYSYIPSESALVVQKLQDAGCIVIGKTNLDQFATGLVGVRSPYGACHSAFNTEYISGGSSSGSSVAVAMDFVSASLGTDTAGSGRVPACFNNIVGLKPSIGRISLDGVVKACRSLDCVSIFAKTVEDCITVLKFAQCLVEEEEIKDARSKQPLGLFPYDKISFKFGVPQKHFLKFFGNVEYEKHYYEAIERLKKMGGQMIEIDYAPFNDTANLLYGGVWVAERTAAIEEFIKQEPQSLFPVTKQIIEGGFKYSAIDAFNSMYKLDALKKRVAPVWNKIDILVLPTAGTCYTIEQVNNDPIKLNTNLGYYTNFCNLLDLSAIAVPNGVFCESNKMPSGITLFAPALQENLICTIGDLYTKQHKTSSVVKDKRIISSYPYAWPFNGNITKQNTCLIIIDMQNDFVSKDGYVSLMGYDLKLIQATIEPIGRVLDACRKAGLLVIHTREGHREDETDLPLNKKWRSKQIGAEIGADVCNTGSKILIRGQKGWEIIDELKPLKGETIVDKPGKGSFFATDIDFILKTRNIQNIILTGVTTDVCVSTTGREANDRGYECLFLEDCTAATDFGNYLHALKMVTMQGGVFGAISKSDDLIHALQALL